MPYRPPSAQRGFTLVELAIVLVIIGMLIGGVLKGQELVRSAKIVHYQTMVESYRVAVMTYLDRYHQLPGDDPGASARFGKKIAGYDGDGDGMITGSLDAPDEDSDCRRLWAHLRAAGLIIGAGEDLSPPRGAFGSVFGIDQQPRFGFPAPVICNRDIAGADALLIDIKYDDGDPARGALRAGLQTESTRLPSHSAREYAHDGLYVVCERL